MDFHDRSKSHKCSKSVFYPIVIITKYFLHNLVSLHISQPFTTENNKLKRPFFNDTNIIMYTGISIYKQTVTQFITLPNREHMRFEHSIIVFIYTSPRVGLSVRAGCRGGCRAAPRAERARARERGAGAVACADAVAGFRSGCHLEGRWWTPEVACKIRWRSARAAGCQMSSSEKI